MNPFREPGEKVDKTEIERVKIHEAEETKREAIREREKTKRVNLDNRDTAGYVFPRVMVVVLAITAVITGGIVTNTWVEANKEPGACTEYSWSKSTYSGITCKHPLHVFVETDKERTCKCGVAKLP